MVDTLHTFPKPRRLSPNERRVLTILSRYGPTTKRNLARSARASWATIVKIVRRLEEEHLIEQCGVDARPLVQGPDSVLYRLSDRYPLSIGVDVEYRHTRVTIAGPGGRVHYTLLADTPAFVGVGAVRDHIVSLAERARSESAIEPERIVGMGVAIPMLLLGPGASVSTELQALLAAEYGHAVRVDDVSRTYALAKQSELWTAESFATITIRGGLGLGLSMGGHVYRGDDGVAGQLAHVVVDPDSPLVCPHCGHRGCLETVIKRVWIDEDLGESDTPAEMLHGLAETLARAVSMVLMIVNVRRIIVSGHFGLFVTDLEAGIRKALPAYVAPFVPYDVTVEELREDYFALGAAFLVLSDYCNYEISP